jgi:molybdenum cofactor cytidylyltransferase
MNAFVSAILLAAGESKRMGKPKLLLPFGDSTIVEQAINSLLNSKINELIIVVGYRAEELVGKIAKKPVKIVLNRQYQQGISTSIIAGLKTVDKDTRGIMIALGDQPLVDSRTIDRLIEEFQKHDRGIIIPVCQGRRGHPVIFPIKYEEELLQLEGDVGGKQIVKDHPDEVLEVAVNCEGILIDIDTVGTYNCARSKLG